MTTKIIKLNSDELWPLLNILNEVCHGIAIINFEKALGEKKSIVINLMNQLSNEEGKEIATLNLTDAELNILNRSFEEVFRQIEEWEFQTRIGITISEAIKIKAKLP